MSIDPNDEGGGWNIEVWYSDGTYERYETEGNYDYIEMIDCPGTLTYVRKENNYRDFWVYYYTYSEAGVDFNEFEFGDWNNGFPHPL